MIPVLIIIGVIVVVGGIAAGVVSGYRSRAAKSDWLGELSDIRRSSLGDDEEVTGALEAIHVGDHEDGAADGSDLVSEVVPVVDVVAWPEPESESETAPKGADASEPRPEPETNPAPGTIPEVEDEAAPEPAPEPEVEDEPEPKSEPEPAPDVEDEQAPEQASAPEQDAEVVPEFADAAKRSTAAATVSNLHAVTDSPNRTIEDAGTRFREYDRPGGSLLRIESNEAEGLRVLIGGSDSSRATCAIDLPGGVLWHLAAKDVVVEACSIRTPAGWVTTTGTMLVLVDDTGWSYAMCLDGVATVEVTTEGRQARLEAGHIGRGRNGTVGFELANVGIDALESEGAVRRQRRLDLTDSFGK